eukprot:XP_011446790.1 PREDICTED: uncharacterized protein LOC105341785 [Crassostrea gigas]
MARRIPILFFYLDKIRFRCPFILTMSGILSPLVAVGPLTNLIEILRAKFDSLIEKHQSNCGFHRCKQIYGVEAWIMDECILCLERLPKKNRRNIYSDTFHVNQQLYEVLGFVPEQQLSPQYTCYRCFNKLNRLSKIDYDLERKLSALKREKDEIINQLRPRRNVLPSASVTSENVGGACSSTYTPRKSNKRIIIRTPTPRKTKKVLVQHTAQPKVRKRLSEDQLTPSKVKVHFRGRNDSKVRTRFIKDSPWVAVLKSLVRGCKAETISKKNFKMEVLKTELVKLMLSDLNSQCQILCKISKPSVLRGKDEIHFKFESVCGKLKEKAQMLYDVLQTVIKKRNNSRFAVAASVLL